MKENERKKVFIYCDFPMVPNLASLSGNQVKRLTMGRELNSEGGRGTINADACSVWDVR